MSVPIFKAYHGLVYTPKSGTFNFGERVYYTEELQGAVADARSYGDGHHRGSIWVINSPVTLTGTFIVEQADVTSERGGIGTVSVKYVWLDSVPPDEWTCTPVEDNPPIERNTFFSALTQDDLQRARGSFLAAQARGQTSINNAIDGTTNAALTKSLINKWLRGQENFYNSSAKYQWKQYFTSMSGIILRRGGYVETPGGPGVLPPGYTWLRTADEDGWNNGLYWVTRTWLGGSDLLGGWDSDIYTRTPA